MAVHFRNIVTLCTGNICRSPMAEALLREALADSGVTVSSAGTAALEGHAADPAAVRLMAERGLDLSTHRGRQATAEILQDSDLVLVASNHHARWVVDRFPSLRGRVFRLTKFSGDEDIPDPYKQPQLAFEAALADIDAGIEAWLPKLK